jgi:hypothetical protein
VCFRDFFLFSAVKAGSALNHEGGVAGKEVPWLTDEELFRR